MKHLLQLKDIFKEVVNYKILFCKLCKCVVEYKSLDNFKRKLHDLSALDKNEGILL